MSQACLSALPGMEWPALPAAPGPELLALLFQLERTEWLPSAQVRELQYAQLGHLLEHAWRTVPFYRSRWSQQPQPAGLGYLPALRRRDLQEDFAALNSLAAPADHGRVGETRTSGSTGTPVRLLKTELSNLFWRALALREHRWHERDLAGKLAVIRHGVQNGQSDNWGPATTGLLGTGPCVALKTSADVESQLAWLQRERPDYLLTYPSNVAQLALASLASGVRLDGLREVRTMGEQLDPEARALCREAWGASLVDTYSAQEVGYIALQCPSAEHYHVQAESLMVEILDDAGRPCGPGQVGRVVVTDLHNFATPLIRYDIGDYAEVGEACACGRGLPVLKRILGRVRNTLVTADGRRYWPSFGTRRLTEIAPVLQHQFVQTAPDRIEARLVTAAPLTESQKAQIAKHVAAKLPAGIGIEVVRSERIERSASGKYEDFVSEVAKAGGR